MKIVFGLWEEAGVPRGTAHMHGENIKLHTERHQPDKRFEPGSFLLQSNNPLCTDVLSMSF